MNFDLEKLLLPWIGKAAKFSSFFLTDTFRSNGIDLTKEQFLLLIKLHQKDGRIQSDLATITDRNKTSLTRLINTLEKKGLVRRNTSDEDKRRNFIFLTMAGRELLKRTIPVGMLALKNTQQGISEEDVATTIRVMKQVLDNIKPQEALKKKT